MQRSILNTEKTHTVSFSVRFQLHVESKFIGLLIRCKLSSLGEIFYWHKAESEHQRFNSIAN